MSNKIELWTLTFASYDGKTVGAGTMVFFTEGEAIESLREEVRNDAIDDLELDAYEDDTDFEKAKDEALVRIAKLTLAELVTAYEDRRDDIMCTVRLQKHDLTQPGPVPTTPEEIEAFLNDQPAPEQTIHLKLKIDNFYEGDKVRTTAEVDVPAPPSEEDEDAVDEWEQEYIFPTTGTGQTEGDSAYFVTVAESSHPDLIAVGTEYEFGT